MLVWLELSAHAATSPRAQVPEMMNELNEMIDKHPWLLAIILFGVISLAAVALRCLCIACGDDGTDIGPPPDNSSDDPALSYDCNFDWKGEGAAV